MLDKDEAIQGYGCEDVDAVHPQQGQEEPRHLAELFTKLPAKLERGGEIHRNSEHGHDQL